MGAIGNLAATITANAEGYFSALDKAAKGARDSAAKTGKSLAIDPLAGGKGALAGVASAFAPGAISALASGASAGGFIEFLKGGIDRIKEQGKAAETAGASGEGYSKLLYAAGGNAEMLSGALFHLTERIGDAALVGGEGAKAFRRLGLDVGALANMKADKQFMAWVNALHAIKNPAERNAAALATMGKSAKE